VLVASLMRHQTRAITKAQVIEELIDVAREMREGASRGEELGSAKTRLRSTTPSGRTTAPSQCSGRHAAAHRVRPRRDGQEE
jgi:hypothetical protein